MQERNFMKKIWNISKWSKQTNFVRISISNIQNVNVFVNNVILYSVYGVTLN